ncbi:peptidyl-prolyl cis-trans isomerase [Jannaschia pagri]|uniref:Parvulin-like PPIase n=1 Tax=Jannaschia pagri TaxID=2829797 RepID=A0ABQ4NPE8_9RHOB|nr:MULTISPECIES: SurA N-terminal domain-containing protein [unclassified Jannaschia]GIT92376.1 peptidyl-prolyl cis-trans isomerase [Jannaschia sp. AI_61]GIT96211.1 peptidyl-prolyl cis-trans isomerase [Jannaschia sp. AI_62]
MSDEAKPKKKTNIVVWAILGLLVLALGGFGAGQFGGSLSTVATVGDREITVQDYGNALQAEQQRLSRQTGQSLTLQQMRMFGLDSQIMERLLATAALEEEAGRMGLSVGDAEVAERIRATPAFGGITGGFDREAYAFALRSAGLNERRFEARVRDEAARELLQAAVIGGVQAPETYVDRLMAWLGETRDATVATVTVEALPAGAVAVTEDQLTAFYDENATRFETPETRRITYAWVTPSDLIDQMDVPEDRIQDRYDDLAADFNRPARVLAERLNYLDPEAAATARAAIDAGETDFDTLVADRGLTLDDVDAGEIAADDVPVAVAEALFGLEEPGIVGPIETGLGAALFRVNAILDATIVPLEEVREDIVASLARDAARRDIDAAREDIDDLLAGGATLEEVADETDMILGTAEVFAGASGGPLDYDAFRAAALAVEEGDFPELESLSDGGLFALRLDGIDAPVTPPLDEIRDRVEEAWQADDTARRLADLAQTLADRIDAGDTFEDVGLTPDSLTGITRDGTVEGLPRRLISELFELDNGQVLSQRGDAQTAFVVRLDAVNAVDPEAEDTQELRTALETQTRADVAADVFDAYGRAVQAQIGFSIDQGAVQAVQSQLLGGAHGGM